MEAIQENQGEGSSIKYEENEKPIDQKEDPNIISDHQNPNNDVSNSECKNAKQD